MQSRLYNRKSIKTKSNLPKTRSIKRQDTRQLKRTMTRATFDKTRSIKRQSLMNKNRQLLNINPTVQYPTKQKNRTKTLTQATFDKTRSIKRQSIMNKNRQKADEVEEVDGEDGEEEEGVEDEGVEDEEEKGDELPKTRMTNARNTITNFVKHKDTFTANFLKHICPDSDDCLGFGTESMRIFDYFQFETFKYVNQLTPLAKGNNGFVMQVQYDRNGYNAFAVLKSALNASSDNLYYEAFVGLEYINIKALPFFPCFMQTYGLYKYKNAHALMEIEAYDGSDGPNMIQHFLNNNILKTDFYQTDVNMSCTNSILQAVLIQHIKNPLSFHTYINNMNEFEINVELPTLLYQLYEPLSRLANEFTHHDLHTTNVFLYTIPNGKCVRMNYIDQNGTVLSTFLTRYIVKIVDYGRSYCDKTWKLFIHPNRKINSSCGYWTDANPHFISILKPNISHDLRLVNIIKLTIEQRFPVLKDSYNGYTMLRPIVYTGSFGTEEQNRCYGNDICNVHAMADALRNYLRRPMPHGPLPSSFASLYGTMNIHVERNKVCEFIIA
jgi:hypothetical protein